MSRNLQKLFLVRFFFWLHFFSAVLVPFLTQTGGLSLSQVLSLNAWFMLCCSLFEAPTGVVADMFGRRLSLAAGGGIGCAAALLYVQWPGLWGFALAETVFAAAYTLQSGADEALLYDALKDEGREADAGRLLARLESAKLLAILLGGLAGSLIAARWGIAAPMKAYALSAALSMACALSLKEPSREEHAARPPFFTVLRQGWEQLRSRPALVWLAAEFAASNALAWSIIWLYQPALARVGVPMAWFGAVHAASALAQAGALSVVGRLERLAGSRRALLTAAGLGAGVSFAALAWAPHPAWTSCVVVAAFTFGLARGPVFSAAMNEEIPSARRAIVLSLASVMRTLAIVAVNPAVGWAADRSLPKTFLALGAGLAVLALAAGKYLRYSQRSTEVSR